MSSKLTLVGLSFWLYLHKTSSQQCKFDSIVPTSILSLQFNFGALLIFCCHEYKDFLTHWVRKEIQIWVLKTRWNSEYTLRSPVVLFDDFCVIRYRDIVKQSMCQFSRSICTNDIVTHLPYLSGDTVCLNHWHESSGKVCMYFAQLYPRNTLYLNQWFQLQDSYQIWSALTHAINGRYRGILTWQVIRLHTQGRKIWKAKKFIFTIEMMGDQVLEICK